MSNFFHTIARKRLQCSTKSKARLRRALHKYNSARHQEEVNIDNCCISSTALHLEKCDTIPRFPLPHDLNRVIAQVLNRCRQQNSAQREQTTSRDRPTAKPDHGNPQFEFFDLLLNLKNFRLLQKQKPSGS